MTELTEGKKVYSIQSRGGDMWIDISHKSVESMEIVLVTGQMANVPWVKEIRTDGTIYLHNCALLESISFIE